MPINIGFSNVLRAVWKKGQKRKVRRRKNNCSCVLVYIYRAYRFRQIPFEMLYRSEIKLPSRRMGWGIRVNFWTTHPEFNQRNWVTGPEPLMELPPWLWCKRWWLVWKGWSFLLARLSLHTMIEYQHSLYKRRDLGKLTVISPFVSHSYIRSYKSLSRFYLEE